MCAWLLLNKVLDAIDVFAGTARLSHCLRAKGLRTVTLDIKDWPSYVEKKSGGIDCKNPLDLFTSAGFLSLG